MDAQGHSAMQDRMLTTLVASIWFCLACYGVANAVVNLHIGEPIRNLASRLHPWLEKLLGCPACLAFWVGLAASFALSPASLVGWKSPFSNVADGLAASASSWILHIATERIWPPHLEEKRHRDRSGS